MASYFDQMYRVCGLVAVLTVACGGGADAGHKQPSSSQAGAGTSERSGGAGGIDVAIGGAGGGEDPNATAGRGATSVTDPNAAEDCTPDPLADHWTATTIADAAPNGISAATGGGLSVVAYVANNASLQVITSTDGAPWSTPQQVSVGTVTQLTTGVAVSGDGRVALVAWFEGDTRQWRVYSQGGWASSSLLDYADSSPVLLSANRAVAVSRIAGGITMQEYDGQQWTTGKTLSTYFRAVFLGADDKIAIYGEKSLEGQFRYEYTPGGDFSAGEHLPTQTPDASFYESFAEFANGRAARLVYHWSSPEISGIHVTPRANGQWAAEERVTSFGGSDLTKPVLVPAGSDLVLVWNNGKDLTYRTHDGNAWSNELSLPRSGNATVAQLAGAGAANTALILGLQRLAGEGAAFTKLWRRGSDSAWFCPRLHPELEAIGHVAAASESGTLLAAFHSYKKLYIELFTP